MNFSARSVLDAAGDRLTSVYLQNGTGLQIGAVQFQMARGSREASVVASHLEPKFRGQGLGTAMYQQAIAYSQTLGARSFTSDSEGYVSPEASRVWRSLERSGQAHYSDQRWRVRIEDARKTGFEVLRAARSKSGIGQVVAKLARRMPRL